VFAPGPAQPGRPPAPASLFLIVPLIGRIPHESEAMVVRDKYHVNLYIVMKQ
jgi:hypothetical protein